MRISVIIPTHQRPEGLRDLLESLSDQEFDTDQFEIHVVSNFAEDPSQALCAKYAATRIPGLHWHFVGTKGANRARNLGLKHAAGELALYFDDDCVVTHRYYLQDIWDAHQQQPAALAIGGSYFASRDAGIVDRVYCHISSVWLDRRSEDGGHCVNLVGGNVSYKLKEMRQQGFTFNDQIEFGGAETELHLRMYLAGAELKFQPDLRVEHRARISARQLLRKAYKQGMAAHVRWTQGLHVPTRFPPSVQVTPLSTLEKLWKQAFDYAFAMGTEHARGGSEKLPVLKRRLILPKLFLGHLYYKLKRGLYRSRFGKLEARPATSLPLQRFYVLPVSADCSFKCSYCDDLGLKQVTRTVEEHLARAKNYGFKEILLPCNAAFTKNTDAIIREVRSQGLIPSLLVNGDASVSLEPDALGKWSDKVSFHLLLSKASSYQDRLIAELEAFGRDFSLTYVHRGWRSGLAALKDLPARLSHRVHFLFPTRGSIWHQRPSGIDIHKFLLSVRRLNPALQVRAAAGFWPVARATPHDREVYPSLTLTWESGPTAQSLQPQFSVVIPTFDNGEQLTKTLRALAQQDLPPELFEVIIVDDGSQDDTLRLLQQEAFTGLKLKYFYWPKSRSPQSEFRAGLARNFGASQARGEFLCFLDADILVPPNYLSDLSERFQTFDVIQARRDLLTHAASESAKTYVKFPSHQIVPENRYWEVFKSLESWSQAPRHWKYTCTYALSLRKSLFTRAGWFSPEFFSYGFEDVDLGFRLAKLGSRFYLAQNVVYHLYPKREALNFHFDLQKRYRALTLSSRVFYRNQLDPEIFNEYYPSYYEPLFGRLVFNLGRLRKLYYFPRQQLQKRVVHGEH